MPKVPEAQKWWYRRAKRAAWALEGYAMLGWLPLRRRFVGGRNPAPMVQWMGAQIRNRRILRESPRAYAEVDRLIRWHGGGLLEDRIDGQTPEILAFFIGYPRSGHSLVGSLLDAHPQAVIGHEINAFRFLKQGMTHDEIIRAIKYNSLFFERFGRTNTGYSYQVPGQHQGSYLELRVAGDKKGSGTAKVLRKDPSLVHALEKEFPGKVRLIHVVRDPWDNIATKSLRTGKSLERSAANYFSNVSAVDALLERYPDRITTVHLEDLIADPRKTLSGLLEVLDLPVLPDYLAACEGVVARSPNRTREKVNWNPRARNRILQDLQQYPFLYRYKTSAP